MTAPDTNTERQARRHSPALIGIAVAVLIAIGAGFVMGGWGEVENDATQTPATAIETPVQPTN